MKIQCVPIKVGTDIRLLWPFLGHLTFSGPKTKKEITFRSEIHSDGLKSWLGKKYSRHDDSTQAIPLHGLRELRSESSYLLLPKYEHKEFFQKIGGSPDVINLIKKAS